MNCFIQTWNVISEQQKAECYMREFTEECIILFSSRVFLVGLHVHQLFYLKVNPEL